MAYRKKYGKRKPKTYKRKRYSKFKKVRRVSRRRRNLPINGFPKSVMARLRYTEEFNMNCGSLSSTNYIFHANSAYDPNYSGGGHQPRGFDRFMAMYDHFTVVGSKITVQYANKSGGNDIPAYWDVHLTDDVTFNIATVADLFETTQGRGFPQQVGTERNYIGFNPRITRKFSAKKFFGTSVLGKSQFQGTAAASPTEGAFFQVVLCPISGNDPSPMTFVAQIEYLVVFTEPKYESAS